VATYRAMKISTFKPIDPGFTDVIEDKKYKTKSDNYSLDKIIRITLPMIFEKEHIKKESA